MKKTLAAVAALAIAVLGVALAPAPALASGHIHGTVTDAGTNAGIANGVILFFQPGSKHWAYTDAAGQYDLPSLPDGTYHVKFTAPGYAPEFWQNSFSLDGATSITVTDGANIQLDAALDDGATIHGTVTDPLGDPIQNARVWFFTANDGWANDEVANVLTDVNGQYSYTGLAPGQFKVFVVTSNDRTELANEWYHDANTLASATVVQVQPAGDQLIDVQLALGATAIGTVTNSIGSPLSGIRVEASSPQLDYSRSDETFTPGTYEIEGLPSGSYSLSTSDTLDFFVPQTETAPLVAGTSVATDFELVPVIPEESEFTQPVDLVSGPTTVTAGKTYTWTVQPSEDSDVYAILYSDPVFLGAAVQENGSSTLTLTIPAATDAGAHLLTFSTYDEDFEGGPSSASREYLELEVLAAAGSTLAATGSEPAVPLAIGLLALMAGLGTITLRRRFA